MTPRFQREVHTRPVVEKRNFVACVELHARLTTSQTGVAQPLWTAAFHSVAAPDVQETRLTSEPELHACSHGNYERQH